MDGHNYFFIEYEGRSGEDNSRCKPRLAQLPI